MTRKWRQSTIVMVILLCILYGVFMWASRVSGKEEQHHPTSDVSAGETVKDPYAWTQTHWVAHALGDIDGVDYTNSLEALDQSLSEGYRCVEFDLAQDKNGQWILRHENQNSAPYHQLSLSEFLSILAQHPQVTAILDSKTRTQSTMDHALNDLMEAIQACDRTMMDRMVIQTYSFEQYLSVTQHRPFPSVLLTLYGTSYTEDQVVAFAKEAKVKVITMPWSKANPTYIQRLKEAGVIVYVHTVNSTTIYAKMLAMGVQGIYTDIILPLPEDSATQRE